VQNSRATPPAAAGQEPTITVIIPTFNRREQIVRCLSALAAQTLPAEKYEAIAVDDGSTDGTRDAMATLTLPYPFSYQVQSNLGPAAARNRAITVARGELVLFIGDDVVAERNLLEEHVTAHRQYPDPASAILGRLDWPEWRRKTALMDYVCGRGHLQFAFDDISRMPLLDYRFFYTSNVSVKRTFLNSTGALFDTTFLHAAFEDTELAYRLQQQGLTLHYADGARAVHDHVIDVEGFVGREERAGEMAVNLYRKHPELDHLAQVAFLDRPLQAVDRLIASSMAVRLLDATARADGLLRRTAAAIDSPAHEGARPGAPDVVPAVRDDLWFIVFSSARLRGKIRALVGAADGVRLAAAEALVAGIRELDYIVRAERQLAAISRPDDAALLPSMSAEGARLKREVQAIVGPLLPETSALHQRLRRLATRRSVSRALRTIDVALELELTRWDSTRLLAVYRRIRGAVKRRLS
jgi:GT2 family glycosyltransferase